MKAAARRGTGHAADGPRQLPGAQVTWAGAVATVTVTGELDTTRAALLARELRRVAASRPQKLILDLHGAVLVNLPGARLMTTAREVTASRCPLVLCTSQHLASPLAADAKPGQVLNEPTRSHRHTWRLLLSAPLVGTGSR